MAVFFVVVTNEIGVCAAGRLIEVVDNAFDILCDQGYRSAICEEHIEPGVEPVLR